MCLILLTFSVEAPLNVRAFQIVDVAGGMVLRNFRVSLLLLKPIGIVVIWVEIGEEKTDPRREVERNRDVEAPQGQVATATEQIEPIATTQRNVDVRRRC